ncbi:DUF6479 family protein [Streptomyces sp. NPDC050738]|uniref:DUF6479 family protein n=1 Tax=Streptomyces sp. NPDC050738 TaxID=3154744 RepID=UPI003422EE35
MNALTLIPIGLVVAAALIAAVWWGIRRTAHRPTPPSPADHPHYPADPQRPPGEVQARPGSNELPLQDTRLTPHHLHDHDHHGH